MIEHKLAGSKRYLLIRLWFSVLFNCFYDIIHNVFLAILHSNEAQT